MIEPSQSDIQVVFRRMRGEDIPQVHAIDLASFTLPWSERSFHFEVEQNAHARAWVAERRGEKQAPQIVAMLVLWLILDEAHLATIAVHPGYRRQRLGSRLLAHALLDAVSEGARVVYLEVRSSNLAAQALYKEFGFEVVGIRKQYYQDNQEDAVLMTLNNPKPEILKKYANW